MGVGKRALRSTIWVAIGTYLSTAISFATSIILARLLVPEYFGVVALASFFVELFGRVREFGFDQALVHRQEDLDKAFSTHFILNSGAFLVAFLLGLLASPILLRFYSKETVIIFLILSFSIFLKGTSCTPRIFLEKELAFGKVVLVDLLGLLLASGLSIWMAYKGFGLSSLVVHAGLIYLVDFFGFWLIKPLRITFLWDREIARWFLKFGAYLWLGGLATFILFKFNDFVAGTFLGAATLGFYSKAFNLAQLPNSFVTSIASRVALPTYAKLQEDKVKLAEGFNLVLRNIVRISVPVSLILLLVAPDFVKLLFGDKWLPMVPILQILSVYAFARAVFDDAGAFLTAIGKPNVVSKYLLVQAGLTLASAPLLSWKFGVWGLTAGLDLILVLGVILAYLSVNREIRVDFYRSFLPSFGAAFLSSLAYFSFKYFLPELNLATSTVLGCFVVFCAFTAALFLIEGRRIVEDVRFVRSKFV